MRIIIIGNGIAGSTAARFIRKYSDHEILMISAEADYPFSRTALMYVYMGHLRFEHTKLYEDGFWAKNRIDRMNTRVTEINPASKSILLHTGQSLAYDILILACGSLPKNFNWPGQDLKGVQGLYHLQDLLQLEDQSGRIRRAVIVGGGLIGIELAEMLCSRHIPVSFLVIESSFSNTVLPAEESAMVNEEIRRHGIDLRLNTGLEEIYDDGQGWVGGVRTGHDDHIEAQFVGLTAGVRPNIGFLYNSDIETNIGIMVDDCLRTSQKDIYAIGDCAELWSPRPGRKAIEAIWYTGRIMGETVARTICKGPMKYDPGIWYNSAKFFDIEYQVYGEIESRPAEHVQSLFWQDSNGKKSIRINYNSATSPNFPLAVRGFCLMGIRYRQDVCEHWIRSRTSIEKVLPHLGLANFDPEFFPQYESRLMDLYFIQSGTRLALKTKRDRNAVTRFLKQHLS